MEFDVAEPVRQRSGGQIVLFESASERRHEGLRPEHHAEDRRLAVPLMGAPGVPNRRRSCPDALLEHAAAVLAVPHSSRSPTNLGFRVGEKSWSSELSNACEITEFGGIRMLRWIARRLFRAASLVASETARRSTFGSTLAKSKVCCGDRRALASAALQAKSAVRKTVGSDVKRMPASAVECRLGLGVVA